LSQNFFSEKFWEFEAKYPLNTQNIACPYTYVSYILFIAYHTSRYINNRLMS